MPKPKYEKEIEEILERMGPDDELDQPDDAGDSDSHLEDDRRGELIEWDAVPDRVPSPQKRRSVQGSGLGGMRITPQRLIAASVVVLAIALLTRVVIVPLTIVAVALFGVGYFLSIRASGKRGAGPIGRRRR
jgi:hypothetical protein